jgi:GAF domain-containing protein
LRTQDAFGLRRRERIADVSRLGLDRERERDYLREIVDTVAERLDTPYTLIDVLLDDAQVFLSARGQMPQWLQEAGGTPLEWSFCRPLVRERRPLTVPDLTSDPLFWENPLVTIGGVRAYAGAPMISHRGEVLGGLCALDARPRFFGESELAFLERKAAEAVELLEAHAEE